MQLFHLSPYYFGQIIFLTFWRTFFNVGGLVDSAKKAKTWFDYIVVIWQFFWKYLTFSNAMQIEINQKSTYLFFFFFYRSQSPLRILAWLLRKYMLTIPSNVLPKRVKILINYLKWQEELPWHIVEGGTLVEFRNGHFLIAMFCDPNSNYYTIK